MVRAATVNHSSARSLARRGSPTRHFRVVVVAEPASEHSRGTGIGALADGTRPAV